MLKQLTLKNFLLVEALDMDFDAGLTTITGESGAGKSILLTALGLLLGDRAQQDTIRPGRDKADVSAEFDLSGLEKLQQRLVEDELEGDDASHCLVRRIVSNQGRSRAFVNGVPVTTQYLRELGQSLVEIYGQNQHLQLSDGAVQRALLDHYGGLIKQVEGVQNHYRAWQQNQQQLAELQAKQSAALDRKDLLSYQLKELTELSLSAGEYEQLEADQRRLASAQSILEVLYQVTEALEQLDALRSGGHQLEQLQDQHPSLQSAQANLSDALSLIDDSLHDIRHYREQVVVDPESLAEIDSRLATVLDLSRKHKVPGTELHTLTTELSDELHTIQSDDSELEKLLGEADELYEKYQKAAQKLSKARQKAAPKFNQEVAEYLHQLGIQDGVFDIEFSEAENEFGTDRVQFMVSANPDFPPGPLNQVASGGEQTRIGLSIQLVAAATTNLPCLILDEADVGVGGTTADTVGRILRRLGKHTQVICITHAPQVAALGNHHFKVSKDQNETQIESLGKEARIQELARMLAGADITDKTLDYADTLLTEGEQATVA